MADDDGQSLAVHQEVFQPLNGLNVQVVGGLVQEDDVRLSEQSLGQQHLHLLLGGQGGHLGIENVIGQSQTLDQAGDIGFGLPATHLGKLGFQLTGLDTVLVGEVLLLIEGILLLHHVVEVLVAHDDSVQHGVGVVLEVVLLQDTHPLLLGNDDLAGGRLQIAGEHPQKRGLARAVGADDAVAVAGGKLQIHVLEQGLTAEVDADVIDSNHSDSFLIV